MRLFSKIFNCLKRVPLSSFLIFCNRIYVNKAQRVPPFTFFGTMRHFPKEKNSKISSLKKNVLRFLSLRYSADFRRSRLVYFFRPTKALTLYVPLFVHHTLLPKVLSTCIGTRPKAPNIKYKTITKQKGFPLFNFFGTMSLSRPLFRLCEIFLKFLNVSKGSPFQFFDILQLNGC